MITFIDLFLQLLCRAGAAGTCFTIIDSVTEALAKVIYGSGSTMDFDHKDSTGESDLIEIADLDSTLTKDQRSWHAR